MFGNRGMFGLRNFLLSSTALDGGGTGGGDGTQNAPPKEPADPFKETFNLWDKPAPKEPPAGGGQQQQQIQQPDAAAQALQLDNYLKEKGVHIGITKEEFTAAVQSGDAASIAGAMQKAIRATYLQAIADGQTLTDRKLAEFETRARTNSRSDYAAEQTRETLRSILPDHMSDPDLAPLVETVTSQFIKNKGLSAQEAAQKAKLVMGKLGRAAGKIEGALPPSGRPGGRQGFSLNNEPSGGDIDWTEFLGGS